MGEGGWIGAAFLIGLAGAAGYRWYRRRRAGKLADELLADALKAKDAFRR
ncbi:MAG: hypothetical protein ACKOCD_01235 [Nitrospiraceae bacterium]